MKNILKPILSLTLIAAVCAAVLATVNHVTKAKIAEIKVLAKVNAAKRVMPPVVKTVERIGDEDAFVGMKHNGEKVAWAVLGKSAKGYGGNILLMVGFTENFNVVTYCKLEANETPGLGSNLTSPDFMNQFAGMNAAKPLSVKKDGGEVQAITAATITSRAVCEAINDARARLQTILAKTPIQR